MIGFYCYFFCFLKIPIKDCKYVNGKSINIFEDGQAYVALSRIKSLKGLIIKNFKIGSIFANKKAREFYESLEWILDNF